MRLPGSGDTRVLLAGVAAFLALVTYVGVAYANTHATAETTQEMAQKVAEELAPWVPNASNLVPVPSGKGGGTAVRVRPTTLGTYEAYVPTLVYQPPPGRRFVVTLWLRGPRAGQTGERGCNAHAGRVAVNVTEQGLVGSGEAPLSEVNTTVPLKTGWHRFTFSGQVEGRRLSLAIYLYRNIYRTRDLSRTWFDVRGLRVKLRPPPHLGERTNHGTTAASQPGFDTCPTVRMLRSLPRSYSAAGPFPGPQAGPFTKSAGFRFRHGIPYHLYGTRTYLLNPLSVASYGLRAYALYLRDRSPYQRRVVLRVADWFVRNQAPTGGWLYHSGFALPGLPTPFASAEAQGAAMSFLERAFRLTGDRRYLQAAEQGLGPFERPVKDGGVRRCLRGDCRFAFFEETPTPRPFLILDGFMVSLVGLYDLSTVAPGSPARSLYLAGRRTLGAVLPTLDRHGLARYDLASMCLAPVGYQAIDIYLLRALAAVQRSREFEFYARRWQANIAKAPPPGSSC